MIRLHPRASSAAALLFFAIAAFAPAALPGQSFSVAAFRRAQAEDKPILVAVHAKWCVSCLRQMGVLAKLEEEPAFERLVRFDVDFDKPGEALKVLDVKHQATLVAYRGRSERGRSSFDTDARSIRALAAKALRTK